MCEACLEMDLYFAYLSEVEAKKQLERQAAQPWQCEVTVIPQDEAPAAPSNQKPASGKASFVCDEPE
jgi:hypothetical protein